MHGFVKRRVLQSGADAGNVVALGFVVADWDIQPPAHSRGARDHGQSPARGTQRSLALLNVPKRVPGTSKVHPSVHVPEMYRYMRFRRSDRLYRMYPECTSPVVPREGVPGVAGTHAATADKQNWKVTRMLINHNDKHFTSLRPAALSMPGGDGGSMRQDPRALTTLDDRGNGRGGEAESRSKYIKSLPRHLWRWSSRNGYRPLRPGQSIG